MRMNSHSGMMGWEVRTVVDVHVWPDVLTLADHAGLTSGKSGFDEHRDLDRAWVLDPVIDEGACGETPDRAWKDEVRANVAWSIEKPMLKIFQIKTERKCRTNLLCPRRR